MGVETMVSLQVLLPMALELVKRVVTTSNSAAEHAFEQDEPEDDHHNEHKNQDQRGIVEEIRECVGTLPDRTQSMLSGALDALIAADFHRIV